MKVVLLDEKSLLVFERHGLDAADAYILTRLHKEGPLKPAQLISEEKLPAEKKLTRAVATRRLRELRTAGLIARLPEAHGDDGRSLPYGLTKQGDDLMAEATRETKPEASNA